MARKATKGGSQTTQLSELLSGLDPVGMEKGKLPPRLEEIALETQLLTLADVSLERETEIVRDLVTASGKQ